MEIEAMRKTGWKRGIDCIVIVVILSLTACGSVKETIDENLSNKKADYKTSRSLPSLEVPPDLALPSGTNAIEIPHTGTTTYSEYADRKGAQRVSEAIVLPHFPDIRVMHDRDARWLVIEAKPNQVWPKVRDFWLKNGFVFKIEDPSIGIMETDWAENRADIPSGVIRNLLGKVFETIYSASTRDKFRVRLDRGKKESTTELYLSHRGAEEVAKGESFAWQSRPSDPELEAEMLRRIMVFLGVTKEKAQGMVIKEKGHAVDRAYLVQENKGEPTLLLARDRFSRAWRRTRIALDRIGFTIEDRDRSRGLFYIRYIDPSDGTEEGEEGWLSKLKFWGEDEEPGEIQYLISLREQTDAGKEAMTVTGIRVLDKAGNSERSQTAERILSLLYEQLK
uniref:Beta-barrel assembly machine subunit BamC n=1 Tax=Candidatus Kentrum sp. UNK TaxID=2126344 RepID=A0A451AYB9_9GAMM|nr:MAG: Beta-barrel assembly machine subunit BamC [Candidatus Kentron sp. UNK]VFK71032.1 MAG: Beta-barrel assembly machine subunit BamC [Candidatus Kentron sp. UNK]